MVRRTEGLLGSISIFTMILAESGERKTSVDEHFIRPVREYECAMFEYAEPEMSEYRADQRAWEAKVKGLESKIAQNSKTRKPTAAEEDALRTLEQSRPSAPRVPRLSTQTQHRKLLVGACPRNGRLLVSLAPRLGPYSEDTAWVESRSCATLRSSTLLGTVSSRHRTQGPKRVPVPALSD